MSQPRHPTLRMRALIALGACVAALIGAVALSDGQATAQECGRVPYNETIITVCTTDADGDVVSTPTPTPTATPSPTPTPTSTPTPTPTPTPAPDDEDDGESDDDGEPDDDDVAPDRSNRGARIGEDDTDARFGSDDDEDGGDDEADDQVDTDDEAAYAEREGDPVDPSGDDTDPDADETAGATVEIDDSDFVAVADPPAAAWPPVVGVAAMAFLGGAGFIAARRQRSEPLDVS